MSNVATLAEVVRARAAAAERKTRQRCAKLRPFMGGVVPGEHARIVAYVEQQIDRNDERDLSHLRQRRKEIMAEAERRA